MATLNSFRKLDVWPLAMELVLDCYRLSDRFSKDERFGSVSQVRRAVVSIPANVAKAQPSAANVYLNHVNIALGSQAELDTELEVAERLAYVTAEELAAAREKLTRVGQMLHGLQRSLQRNRTRSTGLLTLLGWLVLGVLLA